MKKKYLILPLAIIWVTNMYSADSAMGWFAKKIVPLFQGIQNNNNNSDKNKVKLDIETQTAIKARFKKLLDRFYLSSIFKDKDSENEEEDKEILYKAAQDVNKSKATASDGASANKFFKTITNKKRFFGDILTKCGKLRFELDKDGNCTIDFPDKDKFKTSECKRILEKIRNNIH